LGARGANVTLTVGDASAGVALDRAARSIRDGRLEMAYCGAVEMMSEPLLRILAGLNCPDFVGEGCVCLLLETLEGARGRNARVYAEVAGTALGSDSRTPATRWSRDPEAIARPLRRAVAAATGEGGPAGARVQAVFLHAAGYPESDAAEIAAAEATFPGVARTSLAQKTGAFAAAGGLNLAAAVLEAA